MAIGLAHAVLIWGGDILHSYAIAACVLLIVLRRRWWLLFYGIGFGLFQQASVGMSLLLALVVWLVLAVLCRAWLKRHPQGPMEAMWRRLSYGRTPPAPAEARATADPAAT